MNPHVVLDPPQKKIFGPPPIENFKTDHLPSNKHVPSYGLDATYVLLMISPL